MPGEAWIKAEKRATLIEDAPVSGRQGRKALGLLNRRHPRRQILSLSYHPIPLPLLHLLGRHMYPFSFCRSSGFLPSLFVTAFSVVFQCVGVFYV
jgi:hypothetical protein